MENISAFLKAQHVSIPGTVVWVAPFYNRSGYGVGARTNVIALHKAGLRIRIMSVNEVEPGIDDCDLDLIRSLENTPVIPPVTNIITHVPSLNWLKLKFPEPFVRIIDTTFDSSAQGNLPPPEWIEVCQAMDQVWLMVEQERAAFTAAGLPEEKIRFVRWPHPWLHNPMVPPPQPEPGDPDRPFRFLSIAMFQPRRRWDTLIEAFLLEFKADPKVELYLKVNYPPWHPVPGKPRKDLHVLINTLRSKTGSDALITVDEELGTRLGIIRVIDSCNAYVSTDTATTAPCGEARVRHRMVIIPEGLGVGMPPDQIIPMDPEARMPITPEILAYQPHHKAAWMPGLHVQDVRTALRSVYDMSPEERHARSLESVTRVPDITDTVPEALAAIHAAWETKRPMEKKSVFGSRVVWEGDLWVSHSLALINREVCMRLIQSGCQVAIIAAEKGTLKVNTDPRWAELAECVRKTPPESVDIHVRHQWPPDFTPPEQGHWVMMQPWEYGSLPIAWIRPMQERVDEIWVPSHYVKACCISSGIPANRVQVIANGVDIDRFHPEAFPLALETTKTFKFLFVGGTIFRKGIDILLSAFFNAFTDQDDVCLVIKDMGGEDVYKGQNAAQMIAAMKEQKNCPEILYLDQSLDAAQMPMLYTACDCLVHPYRGEGFGLPIAEAMACGLPVIVTNYGAAMDFCTPANAYFVDAEERKMPQKRVGAIETVDFPWLAEPSREVLRQQLRHVFEHRQQTREKGVAGRQFIEQNLSWQHMHQQILGRITALKKQPVRRFENDSTQVDPMDAGPHTQDFLPDEALPKAVSLWHQDRRSQASAMFSHLLAQHPEETAIHCCYAELLMDVGQYDQAIAVLGPVAHSRDLKASQLLASCKVALGQRQAALADLGTFLENIQDTVFYFNFSGKLALLDNNRQLAETCFQKALEKEESDPEACAGLGDMKWEEGRLHEAYALFKKGFMQAPLKAGIARCYQKSVIALCKTREAEPIFKQLSQIHPDRKQLKCLYIDMLLHNRRYFLAKALIWEAIEIFGSDDNLATALQLVKNKTR